MAPGENMSNPPFLIKNKVNLLPFYRGDLRFTLCFFEIFLISFNNGKSSSVTICRLMNLQLRLRDESIKHSLIFKIAGELGIYALFTSNLPSAQEGKSHWPTEVITSSNSPQGGGGGGEWEFRA